MVKLEGNVEDYLCDFGKGFTKQYKKDSPEENIWIDVTKSKVKISVQ